MDRSYSITLSQILMNKTIDLLKKITKPMRGFKAFHSAQATLSGVEHHHMLRKNQHQNSDNMTIFEQFKTLAA